MSSIVEDLCKCISEVLNKLFAIRNVSSILLFVDAQIHKINKRLTIAKILCFNRSFWEKIEFYSIILTDALLTVAVHQHTVTV